MYNILLFLHLLGLVLGPGAGVASMIAMRGAGSATVDQAAGIRMLGPIFVRASATGLAVFWITGLIMLFMRWVPAGIPGLFWVKLVFVLGVTVAVGMIEMKMGRARRGNAGALAQI